MKVKMVVNGKTLVMSLSAAEEIMELAFKNSEVIEEKWNRGENGGQSFYTTHVYPIDPSKFTFTPECLTEAQYRMFKLAGQAA